MVPFQDIRFGGPPYDRVRGRPLGVRAPWQLRRDAHPDSTVWRPGLCDGGEPDLETGILTRRRIHYGGRFYSVTYSGVVESWEQDAAAGNFTSTVVAPRLPIQSNNSSHRSKSNRNRKYLIAAPDGRLMVVLKGYEQAEDCKATWSIKLQVLDGEAGGHWKEVNDIGDTALFVGVNNSLCVSTREHPELKASCVYFTEDHLPGLAYNDGDYEELGAAVYSLKDNTVEKIQGLGWLQSWPRPAWFIP
ncbi:hypothetical protein ACQ4PT_055628 [Festuca glaucescens]